MGSLRAPSMETTSLVLVVGSYFPWMEQRTLRYTFMEMVLVRFSTQLDTALTQRVV